MPVPFCFAGPLALGLWCLDLGRQLVGLGGAPVGKLWFWNQAAVIAVAAGSVCSVTRRVAEGVGGVTVPHARVSSAPPPAGTR